MARKHAAGRERSGVIHRREPVAISGAECITASGVNLEESLRAMLAGVRNPVAPSAFATDHGVDYPVFEIPEAWTPREYNEARTSLKCGELARMAAREALRGAGLTDRELREFRVGVCMGTTVGNALNDEDFFGGFIEGRFPSIDPLYDFLRANPAYYVARSMGISGPVQMINNACTSGAVAIGEAASWIRHGVCDLAVAGGAEKLNLLSYNGFISLKIMDPEPCRPYDRKRLGLTLGEGAGILILESAASLRRRSGKALGWLLGYGNSSDAHHLSAPHPEGRGLERAVEEALAEAGCRPADMAFINSHGTGTPENDRMEGRLFPRILPGVPFGSTKGFTGHTLGASGAIEAALTLACLEGGRIPGNAGFGEPDPEFDGRPVTATTAISGDTALSVSVAFGGNNVALVLRGGP